MRTVRSQFIYTAGAVAVVAALVLVVFSASSARADGHDGRRGWHDRGWYGGKHGSQDDDGDDDWHGDGWRGGVVVGVPLLGYVPPPHYLPQPVYPRPPPPPPPPSAPIYYPVVPKY